MERCTIGIPRALLFYRHEILWRTFFEELGCTVVVSPETNRRILEAGIALSVDESCLPIKILVGHVDYLRGKADRILLPAIESLHKGESVCSKFFAPYDIVRNTFPDLPLIGYHVDAAKRDTEERAFLRMGRAFSRNPWRIRAAYRTAAEAQRASDARCYAEQAALIAEPRTERLTLLIVSHAYTVRDRFFGGPIVDFLQREGVRLLFSDAVDPEAARQGSLALSRDMYWTHGKELLGAINLLKDEVDGILYVVCFPCGPDSLTVELAQRRVTGVPSLVLTVDELQADTGLVTRLESFADILRRRRHALV